MNDYRQGEVRLKEVEKIPINAKTVKGGEILAVGKSNLHSHRLSGKGFKVLEFEGEKFVEVKKPASLVHEEHKTIKLPKGKYKVQIQREYLPRAEARKVED